MGEEYVDCKNIILQVDEHGLDTVRWQQALPFRPRGKINPKRVQVIPKGNSPRTARVG